MLEIPEKLNYEEWDRSDFSIPSELVLTSDSYLHEAIQVFYKAGGLDFFKVINPAKYATNWLDFISGLYADIEAGTYKPDGEYHKNPLSFSEKLSLKERGVPDLFADDIGG